MKQTWIIPLLFVATSACAFSAQAENYPVKPVKLVVPFPPGGTTDVLARAVAKALNTTWGQPVVVENLGGAGGNIGAAAVYRADPDGHSLLFTSPPPLAINQDLYTDIRFAPENFVPISVVASVATVLATNKEVAAKSVEELVAFARKNPGALNYASQGNGTTSHLSGEMLKSMAGVSLMHVPYKGSAPALTGLMGGETDMMFVELSSVVQHIRAGTLKPLAVGGAHRDPLLENVPTMSEVLPGFLSTTWFAIVAPPKTPQAIADKLAHDIGEALKTPEMKQLMAGMNLTAGGTDVAETTAFLQQERARWGKVVRETSARIE